MEVFLFYFIRKLYNNTKETTIKQSLLQTNTDMLTVFLLSLIKEVFFALEKKHLLILHFFI